ncbi:MAG: N-acetylglucosamine kinase [Thiohalospira sp.]
MFIVTDSGSTKTNWTIINKDIIIHSFKTNGLNPYFVNSESITKELIHNFPESIDQNHIQEVYFYGAGCSSQQTKQIILNGCNKFFNRAKITIESDLLGAARALFFNQKGIIAIMGTGSSTGIYNGKKITHQINSLGFAMGDEGSGAHLGKMLLIDYLHHNLPIDLKNLFENKFTIRKDDIIYSIYKKPSPSKFLASFAAFIVENKNHPYIKNLIQKSLQELFEKYICKYPDYKKYPIGIVGSVGYHLKPALEQTAQMYGIKIAQILKNPMKKMIDYHIKSKNRL